MATDNKNTSTPELGNSDDGIKIRAKNRLKAATDNVRGMLKEVLKPVKTYIVVTGIGIALFFAIIVLLTAALWYLKENHTKQDTENPTNVPGTVKNVMTATVSKDPNTGEITFVYNEKKPQANLPTNLGNTSANTSTNSTTVNSLDNFLFIGDSRYEGLDTSSLGSNIKNVGVTSATIAEWKAVAENNGTGTVQGRSVDIKGEYAGISIQLGVNTLISNDFDEAYNKKIVDAAVVEMQNLIAELQKIHPNTPIFVNSCLQVHPKAESSYPWKAELVRTNINSFNKAVEEYCNTANNVYYIDVNHSLNNNEGYLKDEYTGDGLHCNSAGQIEFLKNIKNAITGSGAGGTTVATVDSIIADMTLEEKIYQLLMVQSDVSNAKNDKLVNSKYGAHIIGSKSEWEQDFSVIGSNYKIAPFIATDDEGGSVERAAQGYTGARAYGFTEASTDADYEKLKDDEIKKSNDLLNKGINLNLSPVTDSLEYNEQTSYDFEDGSGLYERSFSENPEVVKKCVKTVLEARKGCSLNGVSMSSTLKHYPGYPSDVANTDFNKALVTSSISEDEINKMKAAFESSIAAGAKSVMLTHVIYEVYDSQNPASLSPSIISELRENFDGVIMTDDIGQATAVSSITTRYKDAIAAGNDMILIWEAQASEAYNQINDAVASGKITEARIDESVKRILDWKVDVGLLQLDKVTNNGSNNDEADSDFLVMTESVVLSKIKNEDGKEEWCIATDLDARVEAIYESLEENSSTGLVYFKNEKEAKEALKLWIMAEYSSQYLNLSEDPENYTHKYDADYIQGSVKVKRYSINDKGEEEGRYITYVNPVDFEQLKSNYRVTGDTKVFDYFTINSEDDLVVAQYRIEDQKCSWTGETDPNGELDPTYPNPNYIIDDARLNYRDLVREYSMPFNLLWAMVVYGEDVSFANELAKLAIDSEIVIGIRDNVTTKVTTTTDTYLKEEKLEKCIRVGINTTNLDASGYSKAEGTFYEFSIIPSSSSSRESQSDEYAENNNKTALVGITPDKYYEKTTVKTEISNYISKEVEYIDSWFAKYKMTYTSENTKEIGDKNPVEKQNTDYEFYQNEIKTYGKEYLNQDDDVMKIYEEAKYGLEMSDNLNKILYNAAYQDIYSTIFNSGGQPYCLIMWNNGQVVDDILEGIQNDYSSLTQEEIDQKTILFHTDDTLDEVRAKCQDIYDNLLYVYDADEKQRIIDENIAANIEVQKTWYRRTVNATTTTKVDVYTKKFNKVKTEIIEKVDKEVKSGETENFISILCKDEHKKAYGGFTGSLSEWFFSALEKNEDTEGYIDLIKYLLYKATDKDFGVTEYDMKTAKFKMKKSGMKNTGIIHGGTVQAKVWLALKALKYTDEQIAGVMGNIHVESDGFEPSRVEYGYDENNGGIGLCQWTNNDRGSDGNNTKLKEYAASKEVTWQDEDTQIEFLIAQMTGTGKAAGKVDLQWMEAHGYKKDAWFNATTIEEATKAFCATYENPHKDYFLSSMPERIKWANYYYDQRDQFEGKTVINNTDFLSLAIEIHDYIKNNGFVYADGRRSAIPVPEGQRYIDCSAYVSWVLYEYGYQELFQNNGNWQYIVATFRDKQDYLESTYGWVYKDPSEAQPGDLLIYPNWEHIEIYAGGTNQYGAGSTDAIRRTNPDKGQEFLNTAIKAITITKPK